MIRDYIREFEVEFNHSTGRSRTDARSLNEFYTKWRQFVSLLTDVTIENVNPATEMDVFCVCTTAALKCRGFMKVWTR